MGSVYALIPARSGSKGLPDKNVLEIDGHPLIAYSIVFALRLGIDRVLVSTDSEAYRAIALRYGAECPYLRGAYASTDTAREEDIVADLVESFPRFDIPAPDLWVWLKPVNPFRKLQSVHRALQLMQNQNDIESVRIISEADARLHCINGEGFLEPYGLGWDHTISKMLRSKFPKVYQPYNLEVFRHQGWVESGRNYMGTRIFPIIDAKITGFDVDDRDTFEIVKALIEARPRPDVVAQHICL